MKFIDIRKRMKDAICSDTQELIMLVSFTPQEGIYAYEEVQPIVRCKDCRFYKKGDIGYWCMRSTALVPEDSGFCAWGERKVMEE